MEFRKKKNNIYVKCTYVRFTSFIYFPSPNIERDIDMSNISYSRDNNLQISFPFQTRRKEL